MLEQPLIENDKLGTFYNSMSESSSISGSSTSEEKVILHVVTNRPDDHDQRNHHASGSFSSVPQTISYSTSAGPGDGDDLPPPTPFLTRQKSKEEEKEEVDVFLPLAPSFRRQASFPHTVRPAPFLNEQREIEFHNLLFGMGFSEIDIQRELKDMGDKAIEDLVREIVERKEKGSLESPKKEEKGEPDESDELPPGPLTLSLNHSYIAEDWKCRFCPGHINSNATEICIQCSRARVLCEELSPDQEKEKKEKEEKHKQEEEKALKETAALYKLQQDELEKLELGPWPCRFCDVLNTSDYTTCKSCLSPKYLSRILFTNEEWISHLLTAQEEQKKAQVADDEYKAEWEKKKAQGGTVECLICFDDVLVKDMVFASCKHNFCVNCWNGYLETRVKDGDVLKLNCPAPKCRRPVERREIKARLNPEMFEKFNKFHTQAQLSLNPNSRWCPTPDCETVMIGSKDNPRLQCPKCKHEICFRCNHDWHTGTCERAARGLMGLAADRATFAAYAMVANIKPCPQCRAPIAKDEGCNHMTCQRCHYEFCWMCRGRYNSNHFAPWNLLGCPGGQAGVLACLGDDRCFCIDCGCGCGLLGFVKRCLLKILFLACGLACCPCLACVAIYHACD